MAKGDRNKLGAISTAEIVRDGRRFWGVNAYTEYHPGGSAARAPAQEGQKVELLRGEDDLARTLRL
jgi:hypothetical protein